MKSISLYEFAQKLSTYEQTLHLGNLTSITTFRFPAPMGEPNEVAVMIFVTDPHLDKLQWLQVALAIPETGLAFCGIIPWDLFGEVKRKVINDLFIAYRGYVEKVQKRFL